MAEGDHVDISEEVNPSVPTLSQPPQTHALPPLTPAGVLPAYSGALPTHLPPPAPSGAPLPPVLPTSAATDDQARIAVVEGTVNQMATNMAELLALLRGPNRVSLSSTPPPGPGLMTEPTFWIPPTQAPENMEAPPPPTLHTSMAHPVTISATAGPFGNPSSTGAHPVRTSTCFHTCSGYDLHGAPADGFPGNHRTRSNSSSSHGAPSLSDSATSRRLLLPGTAPHKHHLPRTGHADSCGPTRLTDALLPRGRRRKGT
ncbi:hypothetical protein CDL15_Pgr012506 [Punica granatum]|uniref:Uncharacterized protein n=1 Tax=Punica granatum TaxID=22663 RepID=A0A218WDW8_PUNGR|nr:hypothetical protein CDL15_Pgr012506 [Punica granatum]